ncbi:hypothetical protein [Paludibacter propionicigenes]|uniref:hypothetical protein n=1 Tax=Paludibacter propionicigenes TaxID=185300 RepID=UPI0011D11CF9|nr:hypothetical protein [Paludibacter propionicigenes]
MSVAIYNADGSEVEHGIAVQSADGLKWVYTVTADNSSLDCDRIIMRVRVLSRYLSEVEK